MKVDRKEVSCSGGGWSYTQKVKIFCDTNQFPSFQFCVPHKNPHEVRGLSKQYHIIFDTKLGHGTCKIRLIPCTCDEFTSMLYKPWITSLTPQQQMCYQLLTDWTYFPVLSLFKNRGVIILSHKSTTSGVMKRFVKFLFM